MRSRFADVLAVAVAGALTLPLYGQTRQDAWFTLQGTATSPSSREIERLVRDELGRAPGGLSHSTATPTTLSEMLAVRAPTDLTFVAGRAADVAEFVRNDRFQTVERLKLEVINARLGASPLYLFTSGAKEPNVRQTSPPPRVLYASRAGDLQPADVQALMGRVLGVQPTVPLRLNSPDELARRLIADNRLDGVDVVAIYDDDPSPFLRDFLRSYDAQRATAATASGAGQLVQMLVFPTGATLAERDTLRIDRLQPVQGNLAFAFVRFDDLTLERLDDVPPAQKDAILAVSAAGGDAAPDSLWVLSNVRSVAGEPEHARVRRLLGDAYFVGLMASEDFRRRCESGGSRYGAYLLDAQLADRDNVVKALAFWSDLVLRSGNARPPEAERLREQRVLVEAILRQRLAVQMTTEGRAALVSQLRGPRATVREQFSDASGSLFDRALDDIAAALRAGTDRAGRLALLSTARARLLSLVEKGSGPACRGYDLGLFGRGQDPFFYLGLVDAYAALDDAASAAIAPAAPR